MSAGMTGAAMAAPGWRRHRDRFGGWLRRHFAFESRGNVVRACLAACLVAGLWSLVLGQDANWDLRNYHLYNGYAALHARWGVDLAPAQLQSYFHPLLDVFNYAAMTKLPAPLLGFLLGALHGLVFALVAAIAWRVLAGEPRRSVIAPALAAAVLASGAFVSELGNVMGDNVTALPMLGALALVLRAQARAAEGERGAWLAWCGAGVLVGLAVALKLTNALYAVALGVAALAGGGRARQRVSGAAAMTIAALLVFALIGGPWFKTMWQTFGNPLFPQFNAWFQGPLALSTPAGDTRFLPKGWVEQLTWPLWFTVRPWRVSEIALPQLVWAVLYLLLLVGLATRPFRVPAGRLQEGASAGRVLCVFVLVAYGLWQAMFSIHRYLAAVEVLVPLLVWWLWPRLLPAAWLRWRVPVLVACVLVAVLGARDWGREPWRAQAFDVPPPTMAAPAQSAVVLVGGEPQAWRVPFLPAEAVYLSAGSNFPAAPAYTVRAREVMAQRQHHYAMLHAVVDRGAERVARMNGWAQRLGWDRQPGCAALKRAVRLGLRAVLDESEAGRCVLQQRPHKRIDVAAGDASLRAGAVAVLAPLGWALDTPRCERRVSRIGATDYPYQWCPLVRAP